jgi:hypothetical protein
MGWQKKDLGLNVVFMFEEISLEQRAIAFRICSKNLFFFSKEKCSFLSNMVTQLMEFGILMTFYWNK